MQIAGEGKPFVKDQGDTIVSVTGRGDDLTVQPKRCKELTAIRSLQKEVVILFDLEGGD